MNTIKPLLITSSVALVLSSGCSTAPETQTDATVLKYDVSGALAGFKGSDPSLNALLDRCAGYAVFPEIGKAGFIAGGAYGRGEVFEMTDSPAGTAKSAGAKQAKKIGYADGVSPEPLGRMPPEMSAEEGAKLGLETTLAVMKKAGVA